MISVLRSLSIIGILLFGAIFYLTYSTPQFVEEIGKEYIKKQIVKETHQKIETITNITGSLSKFANKLSEKNQKKIALFKEKLKSKTNEKIATVIAKMRNLDCECRDKYAKLIKTHYVFQLSKFKSANTKLKEFMQMKYMKITLKLREDIRIFSGSNFMVFLLLLLLLFIKPKAIYQLSIPAILLMLATVICSYFYIFEQNWFFTILYNDYLGIFYLIYLGVVFLFLLDIFLNKARITTEILNAILNIIGSAFQATPC